MRSVQIREICGFNCSFQAEPLDWLMEDGWLSGDYPFPHSTGMIRETERLSIAAKRCQASERPWQRNGARECGFRGRTQSPPQRRDASQRRSRTETEEEQEQDSGVKQESGVNGGKDVGRVAVPKVLWYWTGCWQMGANKNLAHLLYWNNAIANRTIPLTAPPLSHRAKACDPRLLSRRAGKVNPPFCRLAQNTRGAENLNHRR
jgi:hypothetical protein